MGPKYPQTKGQVPYKLNVTVQIQGLAFTRRNIKIHLSFLLYDLQILCSDKSASSWGAWVAQLSVRLQPGHDLAVREFEPQVRLCVSLSLCPSPVHALSLSVPKINKR